MSEGQGAGTQAGQQGNGSGSQGTQGNTQQSLSDQIMGTQGTQQSGTQSGTEGTRFEGMKDGETVEQYITRLSTEVSRARQDAGKYRTELRKYQGDTTTGEDGLTEFQRQQVRLEKLETDLANERNARKAERLSSSLTTALADAGAANPSRAMRLIDASELEVGNDGAPSSESVQRAISALRQDMPQIFNDTRGNGDGGAGNRNQGEPSDFNALIRARAGMRP